MANNGINERRNLESDLRFGGGLKRWREQTFLYSLATFGKGKRQDVCRAYKRSRIRRKGSIAHDDV